MCKTNSKIFNLQDPLFKFELPFYRPIVLNVETLVERSRSYTDDVIMAGYDLMYSKLLSKTSAL